MNMGKVLITFVFLINSIVVANVVPVEPSSVLSSSEKLRAVKSLKFNDIPSSIVGHKSYNVYNTDNILNKLWRAEIDARYSAEKIKANLCTSKSARAHFTGPTAETISFGSHEFIEYGQYVWPQVDGKCPVISYYETAYVSDAIAEDDMLFIASHQKEILTKTKDHYLLNNINKKTKFKYKSAYLELISNYIISDAEKKHNNIKDKAKAFRIGFGISFCEGLSVNIILVNGSFKIIRTSDNAC